MAKKKKQQKWGKPIALPAGSEPGIVALANALLERAASRRSLSLKAEGALVVARAASGERCRVRCSPAVFRGLVSRLKVMANLPVDPRPASSSPLTGEILALGKRFSATFRPRTTLLAAA